MNFVLRVAWRYFVAKKNEKIVSFIAGFSIFGVTIGVAALIVVMAVMNGFHQELTRNIIGLDGEIIIKDNHNQLLTNYPVLIDKILTFNKVKTAIPLIEGQALIVSQYGSSGALVKGIKSADLAITKTKILDNALTLTSNPTLIDNHVLIGQQLALSLGVRLGDKIKLVSAVTLPTIFGSMPRSKDFIIMGIFSSGMYDYDAATILMNLDSAERFFGFPKGSVNTVEVYTTNPDDAGHTAYYINENIKADLSATSWQQKYLNFLNALHIERVTMFAILSLIILVAAFNIISSLFILVKDRTKDIAILKTMGASARAIMLIFMLNGVLIGLIGTSAGVLVGVCLASNIDKLKRLLEQVSNIRLFDSAVYLLDHLPVQLLASNVVMISIVSFILCILASIYPAYKASKLNPVESLRYE